MPPTSLATVGERVAGGRHVERDHVRRRRGPAPGRCAAPMPRAAPVTRATLPSSGRSQSAGAATRAGADPDDLAGDVRRARRTAGTAASTRRRPRRPARRRPAGRSCRGRTPCRCCGRSPPAPAARSPPRASAQASGGVPSTITRPDGQQRPGHRVEEVVERAQPGGVGRCRSRRRPAPAYGGVRRRPRRRPRRASCATGSASRPPAPPSSTGPVDQRVAGLVPAQPRRIGQAEPLDQRPARRRSWRSSRTGRSWA